MEVLGAGLLAFGAAGVARETIMGLTAGRGAGFGLLRGAIVGVMGRGAEMTGAETDGAVTVGVIALAGSGTFLMMTGAAMAGMGGGVSASTSLTEGRSENVSGLMGVGAEVTAIA